jgi:tRNA dimethylallyltransferase
MKKKILIVVGPTSSGKSALAVTLAKKFNGEIISADSRQVYNGLDIGTGKITKKEMRRVPHHLLDVASPKKIFTAHDFVKKAREAIEDIAGRGKLPIVVGGAGFYIDALVGRIILPDVGVNKKLRASLENKTAKRLFATLKKLDPQRAKTIDPHNMHRLVRAIEIAQALGKNPPEHLEHLYETLWIGLAVPKETLEKKIHTRLLTRIKAGMVAEAVRLKKNGLSYKRMESLGLEYRSLARFLRGTVSRAQLIDELDIAIRQYAKRQITYWKRNKDINWFAPSERRAIEKETKIRLTSTS